ncbi:hypothetical protein N7532_011001 [Penicillium argentinense]|uniref:Uncharacterized protein n=1 Tax=Penicillium argentinense TaxID=1131581 RepID=A0A9W9JUC5_9EURO|nr:uncharacterized protein N7532_011001 [Penicillium argentinense]KAJ5081958.1 hypothetical protein N7532_011001 [Penicillium argentinense]
MSPGLLPGFFREFKRNYDFSATQRKHHIIPLAQVDERFITDTVGNGQPSVDTTARDRLESTAIAIQPPGRSPNPFDPSVCSPTLTQASSLNFCSDRAPNCQDWLRNYVNKLVEDGFIAGSAISVVQNAPNLL